MAMPRNVVTILLFAIVCFAILGDIEGPRTRSQGSQSQSPPGSPRVTSRLRRGFTSLFRSGTQRRQDGEGPSRTRSSVSRSRSRSRSRSLSPEPTIPPGINCDPVRVVANTEYERNTINTLAGNYQRAKDAEELSVAKYTEIKTSLNNKARADYCFSLDTRQGNARCVQALNELQSISENFRGPCGKAFASFCHVWPLPQSSTCSFFIKKTRGNEPPFEGCVIKIGDCVQPMMSPEAYKKHFEDVADSYIVSPDH